MKIKNEYYEERREILPPSVLFRMLKEKRDNELNDALKKCVVHIIPSTFNKSEKEIYEDTQIDALSKEKTFIQGLKDKCKTGLIDKYLVSFRNKIKNIEKENEDPIFKLKLKEIGEI